MTATYRDTTIPTYQSLRRLCPKNRYQALCWSSWQYWYSQHSSNATIRSHDDNESRPGCQTHSLHQPRNQQENDGIHTDNPLYQAGHPYWQEYADRLNDHKNNGNTSLQDEDKNPWGLSHPYLEERIYDHTWPWNREDYCHIYHIRHR